MPERSRPPCQYPATYKLAILTEYEQLDKAGKGALLRCEGLYTWPLSEWRKQRDQRQRAAELIEMAITTLVPITGTRRRVPGGRVARAT